METTRDYNARLARIETQRKADAYPMVLKALRDAVRYIEVTNAYRGAMTAAEVEAAIIANANVARVAIGANSCNTLASFDIQTARALLADQ